MYVFSNDYNSKYVFVSDLVVFEHLLIFDFFCHAAPSDGLRAGRVGFIPLGTTNDFAKSLHVSRRKILDFAKNFDKYIPYNTDVGLINNNNVFVYIVAFGIFCKSSYKTDYKLKHKFRKIILYST